MCYNQGQTTYTRKARTRTVAIKLNMPNPFFALALGLCTQSEILTGERGVGTTSFHRNYFCRLAIRGCATSDPVLLWARELARDALAPWRWEFPIDGAVDLSP
jgi:hypothetical protein